MADSSVIKQTGARLRNLLSHLYLVFSFGILDAWLRVQTRWIGAYSIFEPEPNLFTLGWALILTALITMVPSRKWGRILYGLVYGVCMVYAVVQYGAYLLLGKFLYLSDFLYAGEGADYASWVVDLLTPMFLVQVVGLVILGIIGILLYPAGRPGAKHGRTIRLAALVLCAGLMSLIPGHYRDTTAEGNIFQNPALEYQRFINPNFDVELTGMYQFLVRDAQLRLEKASADHSREIEMIDAFFAEKPDHADNAMTGLLAGKNVIIVMMETVDDWAITPEDTPTLHKMMSEGICFTNMYTPQYSNGYTFNSEFAFNTSIYPYSNGNAAYTLHRNEFPCSVANMFTAAGYRTNSFHEGKSDYYNRGQMHVSLGYGRYHSYQDYPAEAVTVWDDRFLVSSDGLYGDLVAGEPFCSFVISYTPHLPYTDEDPLAQTALARYPQYDVAQDREVAILRAKVRLTDDMFAGLLRRLEDDGLLEDTVIIGFGDHYAYGLSDRARLQQLSQGAGSSILERTSAFVYCAGCDLDMAVDKVMQITDLAPTIMNLFGLDVPKQIMGSDIFDENYAGYAIFAGGSWLTGTTYVKNGVIVWNDGMSPDQIDAMNAYVQRVYQVNDAILDADYYAR